MLFCPPLSISHPIHITSFVFQLLYTLLFPENVRLHSFVPLNLLLYTSLSPYFDHDKIAISKWYFHSNIEFLIQYLFGYISSHLPEYEWAFLWKLVKECHPLKHVKIGALGCTYPHPEVKYIQLMMKEKPVRLHVCVSHIG